MIFKQWLRGMLHCTLAGAAFVYALHAIHNAWGMVILAWCYIAGFLFLVNTVDLLTGGRLRKGGPAPMALQQGLIIRRVILEEITPVATERRGDV